MNHEDEGAISIAGIRGSRARAATECAALETDVVAVGGAGEGGVDESSAAGSTSTGIRPRSRAMSGTSPTPSKLRAPSSGRITTIESLREHLQWAIELEHSTLPPYLCALYSLDPGRNPEATEVMVSVLVEEMLHMTLAANLMNAVGGWPRLDTPEMLAPYPRWLPHGDRSFEVPLVRFGLDIGFNRIGHVSSFLPTECLSKLL